MEDSRCAVVTGGNRGIGFEICRQLALNDIKVILTARNETRGVAAVQKLNASGVTNVVFHQLDITDLSSIAQLVQFLQTHFTKLDILVNNAALFGVRYIGDKIKHDGQVTDENGDLLPHLFEETYEMGEEAMKANYYGTKNTTEALLPLLLLSKSPRIVNVTSSYGALSWISNEKLKEELRDSTGTLTAERLDEIVEWFLRDFKAGKSRENGWPITAAAYKLSKVAINAYTRIMANKYNRILVNCVHPGYVDTSEDYQTNGMSTAEEAAKGPVIAALLPDGGPSGVYYDKTEIAPFN